jgi:hypothetical protein
MPALSIAMETLRSHPPQLVVQGPVAQLLGLLLQVLPSDEHRRTQVVGAMMVE